MWERVGAVLNGAGLTKEMSFEQSLKEGCVCVCVLPLLYIGVCLCPPPLSFVFQILSLFPVTYTNHFRMGSPPGHGEGDQILTLGLPQPSSSRGEEPGPRQELPRVLEVVGWGGGSLRPD